MPVRARTLSTASVACVGRSTGRSAFKRDRLWQLNRLRTGSGSLSSSVKLGGSRIELRVCYALNESEVPPELAAADDALGNRAGGHLMPARAVVCCLRHGELDASQSIFHERVQSPYTTFASCPMTDSWNVQARRNQGVCSRKWFRCCKPSRLNLLWPICFTRRGPSARNRRRSPSKCRLKGRTVRHQAAAVPLQRGLGHEIEEPRRPTIK
ncbi:hypothetical protein N657DRAFT_708913 [Parathielavia appendiculata]|uniref:Uncharacterized protein n=1 Tax=Parathielavia appendiculata TaxID=2587402 RepID=A0AAN6Z5B6_9PEZI|nr:hypothetical protein N657DRAFT_708913 [Parathielavia appendiculata]